MFKLLSIRPLEGCADYIQKCLKTGMMYYFCNDYIIEPGSHIRRRSKNIKPLKEDFFTVVPESDYSEDNSSERKSPTVSVSAIVGMNGDGKSTLVELMMRLINNCAISYELCALSDNSKGKKGNKTEPHYNLRRVENAKAELYYMIDNVVYRMAEEKDQKDTRIWKVLELNPFNEKGEELMRWEIDSVEIQKVEDDPKGFFFTIVSNYSHYAYNIYDYKKEWEIRGGEKDDDEKCWLHYIFHKNDGYLTPITLHPYRYKGNIDINVEKDLSKQRLLSLFLNADNPSENDHSFRRVNGKDANVLRLTEETESKLQQRAIIDFFKETNQENKFKTVLDEIDKVDKEIDQVALYYDSKYVFFDDYKKLIGSILPESFIAPIRQIIEQDGFGSFVNNVVNKIIPENPLIIENQYMLNYLDDISTVISCYQSLKGKIENFILAVKCNKKGLKFDFESDYDKAIQAFGWAISLFPSFAEAYNNRGNVYFNIGNMKSALDDYHNAANLGSKSAGIYYNIGNAYYNNKDYNAAFENYTISIELDPKNVEAYYNRGNAYYKLGDYDRAIQDYSVAKDNCGELEERPIILFSILNNQGNAYYKKENYELAVLYYSTAIDLYPNYAETFFNRGKAFVKMDKKDLAIEDCNTALALNPDYANEFRDYANMEDVLEGNESMHMGNAGSVQISLANDNQRDKSLGSDYGEEIMRFFETNRIIELSRGFEGGINSTQLGRLDTLYRIIKTYNFDKDVTKKIDLAIVTKNYSELSPKEKCQHYIVYKVWSILSSYPQFQKAINKDKINSLREYGPDMEKCIEKIKIDYSHITRKLKQTENFIDEIIHEKGLYERLGKRDEKKQDNLLVEIDKLKEHYGGNPIPLDNLPPPIYNWDILFKKKDDSNCDIELDSFSSGEKQMLYSIGAIIYHLQNLANTSSRVKYYNVNLVMEEIELYYHPEYQRLFLIRLLDSIRRAKLGNTKNINIVFVTHSPFILSDMPKCNVLFLKDGMPKDIMQENTFGANIHTLLKNGFFMPNLPIGEFAYGKINKLFGKLNSGELDPDNDLDEIYQEILLVGEPFLRNQLLMLYNSYKGSRVMPVNTNKKGIKS